MDPQTNLQKAEEVFWQFSVNNLSWKKLLPVIQEITERFGLSQVEVSEMIESQVGRIKTKFDKIVADMIENEKELALLEGRAPEPLSDRMNAIGKNFSGDDVEGAARGIVALDLAVPDQESDEYLEATQRILSEHCPVLRWWYDDDDVPEELEEKAEEMMNIIYDGVERMKAVFHRVPNPIDDVACAKRAGAPAKTLRPFTFWEGR